MLVKINSKDAKDLLITGVSPRTIEAIQNAKKTGSVFKSKTDLLNIGLPQTEVDLLTGYISYAVAEPLAEFQFVNIKTQPSQLLEYTLYVKYKNKKSNEFEQDVYLLDPLGKTRIKYDKVVADETFSLIIKAPTGEMINTDIGGNKATHHEVKKESLGNVTIKIEPFAETQTANNIIGSPSRLKGRLISNNSSRKLEKIQLVFFIATSTTSDNNLDFYPVCYAETEASGYFFSSPLNFKTAADYNTIIKAKVKIAIEGNHEIDIRLEPANPLVGTDELQRGKLPEKVILYLEESNIQSAGEKDCDCNDMDFHQKKVLDEFSYNTVVRTTEPLIRAYEISDVEELNLEDLLDDINIDQAIKNSLAGIRTTRTFLRSFINRNEFITKDNVNRLIQETQTEALKAKLNKQRNQLAGRLTLDNNNSVDWDKKATIYEAVSISHGHLLNFKQEWTADGYSLGDLLYSLPLAPGQKKQIVVFDWDRKDSAANSQSMNYQESLYNSLSRDRDINEVANATVNEHMEGSSTAHTWGIGGGIAGTFGAGIFGVAGGYGGATSSASQDSSRNTTASSQQQVQDRTVQAASSVRSQRSTVIQTVSQGEKFQVSAESIANYNHCHAMTMQYFEVLRHFKITTRLANVQECLLIPLDYSQFDRKKTLRWRDILSNSLRKGKLRTGFDAIERIEEEMESESQNYYDKIGFPKDNYAELELSYLEGELHIEFNLTRPRDWEDNIALGNWTVYTPFLGDSNSFYNAYLKDSQDKDDAFAKHAGPILASAIVNNLKFFAIRAGQSAVQLPLDATLLTEFKNKTRLNVSIRMDGNFPQEIQRQSIDYIEIRIDATEILLQRINDILNEGLNVTIHSGSMRYKTEQSDEYLFKNARIKNDLTIGDGVRIFTPLSRAELRNPRNEDVEACNSLLHHLNENLEYYHRFIWLNMDRQRRFMLLDGLIAPGKANGRSVASVVENRLIGIVGNCLVMPVSPGFQLDPTMDADINLYQHYYADPLDPISLSLPTKGVFAEAVMGKCNSCEKKDESRFWRWEESPIPDSPTTINPISTPVPQNTQPNLQGRDFPSPIINLQNAPSIPDPQGYNGLLQLLSNPNLFRDITGLTENQKNALAAMQQAMSSAEKFGSMGADWSMDKARLDTMKDLYEKGLINKEDMDKVLNEGGKEADLTRIIDNNNAAKNGQITEQQRDILNPQSEQQKINSLTGKLGAIQEAVKNNAITPQQGYEKAGLAIDEILKEKIVTSSANPALTFVSPLPISTTNNPFISYTGHLTPDMRCFYPNTNSKSLTVQFFLKNFSFSANRISEIRFVAGPNNIEDITSRNVPPLGYLLKNKPENDVHKLVMLELYGITPGVYDLVLEEFDNSTPRKLLDSEKLSFSVPQCFYIRENTDIYESVTRVGTLDNPHLFDSVLSELDLLDVKQSIFIEMRHITELLLKDFNVRLFWKIGPFDEDLPWFSDKYKENTGIDLNERFQTMTLGNVSIGGMPALLNANNDGTSGGYTVGTQIVTDYNRPILITPGVWLNILDPALVSNSPIVKTLNQLLPAYKLAGAAHLANSEDESIRTEYIRLKTLCMRLFARSNGFTIAHEIAHVLTGPATNTPLDSGGHHQPFPDFEGRGLLSGMFDIEHVTGISIANPEAFPAPNSYSWTNSDNLIRNYNLDDDPELVKFIQEKVPIPPVPPFDK